MTDTEINAQVAEKVMGWKWIMFDRTRRMLIKGSSKYERISKEVIKIIPIAPYMNIPPFSISISHAFEVVEKMRAKEWMFTLMNWNYYGDKSFTAKFRNSDLVNKEFEVREKTAARAICLAALKTLDKN